MLMKKREDERRGTIWDGVRRGPNWDGERRQKWEDERRRQLKELPVCRSLDGSGLVSFAALPSYRYNFHSR
jgi:hypothetical protein